MLVWFVALLFSSFEMTDHGLHINWSRFLLVLRFFRSCSTFLVSCRTRTSSCTYFKYLHVVMDHEKHDHAWSMGLLWSLCLCCCQWRTFELCQHGLLWFMNPSGVSIMVLRVSKRLYVNKIIVGKKLLVLNQKSHWQAQEVQKLLKRKRAKADKKMEVENRKKHRLEEH